MPTAITSKQFPLEPQCGFMTVQVEMLHRLDRAPVDVFVQGGHDHPPTLYCRAGLPLENHQLLDLREAGVSDVLVRASDFHDFGCHVFEMMEALTERDAIPAAEQFSTLQLAVAMEVERTIQLVDCGKFVDLSHKIGREITSYLAKSRVLPRDLFRMARHDFTTFTHVTNVAAYAVVLAEQLGTSDLGELEQIATAAMLHDIGKRHIPAHLLAKPTRLSTAEREIIQTHPIRGYEELCVREELTVGQLMMVYQHHERIDGQGYPVGVGGDQIHPWARMLAVVDVFDALTGRRSYRRAASARDALSYLHSSAGTHFDVEAVRCWASAMNNR